MTVLGSHTVEVLRATTTEDRFGNETRSWETATETLVSGCSLQPLDGPEQTVGRDTVIPRWRLFAPPTIDLQASDRVRFAGEVYEVDGAPQRWDFDPLGHVVTFLRRA